VREEFLESNLEDVKTILNIINNTTEEFKLIPSIDKTIANRYDQKLEDVQEWLSLTEWSQDVLDETTIMTVQEKLLELDIIPKSISYSELIHDFK
jgi:hypothetical protein